MSAGDVGEPAFIEFVPMHQTKGQNGAARRPLPLPREALGEWGRDGQPPRRPGPPAVAPQRPPVPSEPRRDTRSGYQDAWLNRLRHDGTSLELRCLDGTVIAGRLRQFDTFSLVLEDASGEVLVFKHAVATIRPRGQ